MITNNLFEFDKGFSCHCEEGQSPDAAIQKNIILIGTDEAGRGPGAGGVFASAVCFFNGVSDDLIEKLSGLNDSKKLSKKKREELYDIILENTINSTVCIEVEEIEKINILNASLKAMRLAVENVIRETVNRERRTENCRAGLLSRRYENVLILIDGNKLIKNFDSSFIQWRDSNPALQIKQQCIIKGDSKSASIAAASILAKVSRDRYMEELDKKFPQYNWKQNAGYLTAEHLSAIDRYGITPHHRKSFLRKHEEKCNTVQLSLYQK